jgi:type II secretory pathway component PulF
MIVSWLIAVPRIRRLAEDLGVEMPVFTRILVDHAGAITAIALVIAILGIIALELSPRRQMRIGLSILTSLISFGVVIWDLVAFWLVYVATLEGLG